MPGMTKQHFRSEFKRYVEEELCRKWDALQSAQRSRYLTEFYTKKVLALIYPALVPDDEDEFESCMTDGSGDHGVDFLYRNQGRVLIIQTKYAGKSTGITKDQVESFRCILSRLYKASHDGSGINSILREALAEIEWETDIFDIRFVALARVSDSIKGLAIDGAIPIPEIKDIGERCSFSVQCESDLNMMIREALNQEDYVDKVVDLILSSSDGEPPWLTYKNSDGRTCYIGRIKGNQIAPLVKTYPSRLFSLNIRSYLGDQATNKVIFKTALENPEEFFFFNNGVSAVATSIEANTKTRTLSCTRLSIINGAQTVSAIKKAFYDTKAREASSVEVLIRITETNLSEDSGEGGFLEQATQFNNTQASIRISDFRSNDPIQKDLKRRFEKLRHPSKTYLYKNKREKSTKRDVIAIGMEEFAKSIHALFWGPADYYGGSSYLFDPGPEGGYVRVFGDGKRASDSLEDSEFRLLAGGWLLCATIREFWQSRKIDLLRDEDKRVKDGQQSDTLAKPALERRWLVYYVVGLLMTKKLEKESYQALLRKLSRPNWTIDPKDDTREKVQKYVHAACDLLVALYAQESAKPGFVSRNFYRNRKHLGEMESFVSRNRFYIDNLPVL